MSIYTSRYRGGRHRRPSILNTIIDRLYSWLGA